MVCVRGHPHRKAATGLLTCVVNGLLRCLCRIVPRCWCVHTAVHGDRGVLCVHRAHELSTRHSPGRPAAADAGAQRALGCVLNSENKLAAYATRARQPRSLGVGGHQHWVCTSLGRSALLAVCCEERGAQGAALPVPLAPGGGASLTPACAQAPLCIECPPLGTRTRPSTILRHRAPVDDIHRSSCNLCLRLPILRSFVRSFVGE